MPKPILPQDDPARAEFDRGVTPNLVRRRVSFPRRAVASREGGSAFQKPFPLAPCALMTTIAPSTNQGTTMKTPIAALIACSLTFAAGVQTGQAQFPHIKTPKVRVTVPKPHVTIDKH